MLPHIPGGEQKTLPGILHFDNQGVNMPTKNITKLIHKDECTYRLTLPVTMPDNSGILCADYADNRRVIIGVCTRTNIIKAIMFYVDRTHRYREFVSVPVQFTFLVFGAGDEYLRHTVCESTNSIRMQLDVLGNDAR